MISVVIPLYNKASFIEETLRSVFNQSYTDYEIIVVDDGSTDNGPEIVGKLKNARLRLISQPNSGVSVARNTGIREARGEYVAFLDADDIWKPDYLQTQNDLITRYPQCDVFVTKYEFMNENGQVTPVPINKLPFSSEDGLLTNYFQVAACSYPPIWTGCVVVRKKVFGEIGYFPKGIKLGEDLITWAKLACRCRIAYSRKVCASYVFLSAKSRLQNDKAPDRNNYVGTEFRKLAHTYPIPYLSNTAALWHKSRMVTFLQFGHRKEARYEFSQIRSYIRPKKKDLFWYLLSFFPATVAKWVIAHK